MSGCKIPSSRAHHQSETAMPLSDAHGSHAGYFPGHHIDSNVSQVHYSRQMSTGGSCDPCLVTAAHTFHENQHQSIIPAHSFDDHSVANRQ